MSPTGAPGMSAEAGVSLSGGGWPGAAPVPDAGTARFGLVRRVEAGGALETVLVSAVATLLGIRAYLQATGFPQVGGGGLHIAHMLWGGLLMLIAVVLALIYIGRPARSWRRWWGAPASAPSSTSWASSSPATTTTSSAPRRACCTSSSCCSS